MRPLHCGQAYVPRVKDSWQSLLGSLHQADAQEKCVRVPQQWLSPMTHSPPVIVHLLRMVLCIPYDTTDSTPCCPQPVIVSEHTHIQLS